MLCASACGTESNHKTIFLRKAAVVSREEILLFSPHGIECIAGKLQLFSAGLVKSVDRSILTVILYYKVLAVVNS